MNKILKTKRKNKNWLYIVCTTKLQYVTKCYNRKQVKEQISKLETLGYKQIQVFEKTNTDYYRNN